MATVEKINQFIGKFKEVYDEKGEEINPIPDNVKLTVYCDNDEDERGFLENVTSDKMGLEALIAQKWILQSELDELMKEAMHDVKTASPSRKLLYSGKKDGNGKR